MSWTFRRRGSPWHWSHGLPSGDSLSDSWSRLELSFLLEHAQTREKTFRFEALANRAVMQLAERVTRFQYGLRGARGAVVAVTPEQISRESFHRYSLTRNIELEFPGAHGFGFVRKVPRSEVSEFLERARADGAPRFEIREIQPHGGDHWVIQYLEPEARNAEAIGIDLASEPKRQRALQDAVQTGEATLTAPLTLVQAKEKAQQGFLFLIPIYSSSTTPETAKERRREAIGLAFVPVLILKRSS